MLSQLCSGWFLRARSYSYCPAWLPGPFWLHQEDIFINQPRTKAVTLPPSDHPSATTLNTQRSWTIAACSSETSSQPDARNEFQSREKRDPHISEKCHTGRGKYLSFWLLSTLSVERLLAEGEDRIHIVQGLLTRSLQRFTCPPAQDKGTTSQLKLRLNRLQGLADKHRVPV